MDTTLMDSASDMAALRVKIESVDENVSKVVLGNSPAGICDYTACAGRGDGSVSYPTAENPCLQPMLFSPVLLSSMKPTPAQEKTAAPSGSDFSSEAVLCLIEGVGRRWGLYETRERSQLFQSVQMEMAMKGHVLPVEKIRRKWNNLIVTYKRVKDRSRETGHAKTSWEFYDLMEATLSDTVGAQINNSSKSKSAAAVHTLSAPLAKIASKPPPPEPLAALRPRRELNDGGALKSAAHAANGALFNGVIGGADNHAATAVKPIDPGPRDPEVVPFLLLSSDIVTSGVHPAAISPSPSVLPSFGPTNGLLLPSASHGAASQVSDVKSCRYISLKAPSCSSGAVPSGLSNARLNNPDPTALAFTSPAPLPSGQGAEGPSSTGHEGTWSKAPRQRGERDYYHDQGAHRKAEARDRRRERREARMAESLGRIATALELLSSKQDTVIALLQRLADRK